MVVLAIPTNCAWLERAQPTRAVEGRAILNGIIAMTVRRAERVGQQTCGQPGLILNVMLRLVLYAFSSFLMLDAVHPDASLIAHGTLHIAAPVCFVCVFRVPDCSAWCVPIPYPTVMFKSYHPSGIMPLALLSSRFHLVYYRYWPCS